MIYSRFRRKLVFGVQNAACKLRKMAHTLLDLTLVLLLRAYTKATFRTVRSPSSAARFLALQS